MSNSIVFVHGAWLTKRSWENFTPYFEQQGYTCLTPEWPYRDASVEELRAHTPPELAEIGVPELTDHFAAIIKAMPEPPILIGHSFGGLIVQQLLDRDPVIAQVLQSIVAGTRDELVRRRQSQKVEDTAQLYLRTVEVRSVVGHDVAAFRRHVEQSLIVSSPQIQAERV